MAELKPCPFCGEKPHHTAPSSDRAGWEIIQCWSCGAQVQHYEDRPAAIAAWNRRPEPGAAQDGLDEVLARLDAEAEAASQKSTAADEWHGYANGLRRALLAIRLASLAARPEPIAPPHEGREELSDDEVEALAEWLTCKAQEYGARSPRVLLDVFGKKLRTALRSQQGDE